jgi:hypothetical protein
MTTVNSLSGGKTSSYLAVHYPADIEMFAVVCIDDHNANGNYWRKNKGLLQKVQDKLEKTSPHWPEFKATAEDPQTLITMLELEQFTGREITWVRGVGFESLIQEVKKCLPNISMRWCTEYMKIIPMFEYIYLREDLPVDMRIGFRYDESERANDLATTISFPISCKNYGEGRQEWVHDFEYRTLSYPLIDDKVMRPMVNKFWDEHTEVSFPEDTGCQICFWKHPQQIKLNYNRPESKSIVQWAHIMEAIMGNRFKKEISMDAVRDIGVQMDFFGGTGPGCKAGICGI